MSQITEKLIKHWFGEYETTSLEGRMKISMIKKCHENMIRFNEYVFRNFNRVSYLHGYTRVNDITPHTKEVSIEDILDEFLLEQHKKAQLS